MKILFIIIVIFTNTNVNIEKQNINCEWLYHSGQGTNLENQFCSEEFKKIEASDIKWKRELLESRGIY